MVKKLFPGDKKIYPRAKAKLGDGEGFFVSPAVWEAVTAEKYFPGLRGGSGAGTINIFAVLVIGRVPLPAKAGAKQLGARWPECRHV